MARFYIKVAAIAILCFRRLFFITYLGFGEISLTSSLPNEGIRNAFPRDTKKYFTVFAMQTFMGFLSRTKANCLVGSMDVWKIRGIESKQN